MKPKRKRLWLLVGSLCVLGAAALTVSPTDAFENADRVERFRYTQAIADLHRPVDHDMWVMTPQTVNAAC